MDSVHLMGVLTVHASRVGAILMQYSGWNDQRSLIGSLVGPNKTPWIATVAFNFLGVL